MVVFIGEHIKIITPCLSMTLSPVVSAPKSPPAASVGSASEPPPPPAAAASSASSSSSRIPWSSSSSPGSTAKSSYSSESSMIIASTQGVVWDERGTIRRPIDPSTDGGRYQAERAMDEQRRIRLRVQRIPTTEGLLHAAACSATILSDPRASPAAFPNRTTYGRERMPELSEMVFPPSLHCLPTTKPNIATKISSGSRRGQSDREFLSSP
mmetsp:Transcript_20568/g.48592  ORF Transcript_20568/g.48592 Transcript_20568/m.48592 type:complete len:211 (+) Transcript_20568:567-1199(+)